MIKAVESEKIPKPKAPYSPGVMAGDFLFVSGQIGVSPVTGEVPETVAEQTKQALENMKTVLEAAGASLDNVVKTTVFLSDITSFEEMNKAYAEYFKQNPPARSTIQAKLARDAFKVEIEATAYIGKQSV